MSSDLSAVRDAIRSGEVHTYADAGRLLGISRQGARSLLRRWGMELNPKRTRRQPRSWRQVGLSDAGWDWLATRAQEQGISRSEMLRRVLAAEQRREQRRVPR